MTRKSLVRTIITLGVTAVVLLFLLQVEQPKNSSTTSTKKVKTQTIRYNWIDPITLPTVLWKSVRLNKGGKSIGQDLNKLRKHPLVIEQLSNINPQDLEKEMLEYSVRVGSYEENLNMILLLGCIEIEIRRLKFEFETYLI